MSQTKGTTERVNSENVYEMKRIWFKTTLGVLAMMGLGIASLVGVKQVEAKGEARQSGVFATVIYSEQINVRSGPSTVYYPVIGSLFPGDVVPALGVSPGHEWVQIAYPSAPGGVGWVYAIYVSISGGELQVVEAPGTRTPEATATIDATLAAQFNFAPTASRMPTFTPPSPLVVPAFTEEAVAPRSGTPPGFFVLGLVVLSLIGLFASFFVRR
jgi:hypothetical protein